MTDIGEMVHLVVSIDKGDKKCDYKPEKTQWKANLVGSSEALAARMGSKPDAKTRSAITNTQWPSQAHHLIPHKTLINHSLKKWLDSEGGFIYAPTKYNVDHKNNGKWMPFASSLAEWETSTTAEKRAIMFEVMRISGIQLHQGPHSKKNDYGVAKWPYKARVEQYLDKIKNSAVSHYAGSNACADCKSKRENGKYPPRENTVTYVDTASGCINREINQLLIFVSRIAAEFQQTVGFSKQ